MMLRMKWLRIPWSNETRPVPAVQLWEVRWMSRHGEYHGDVKPELEAFTSEEAAEEFAESLRQAFKLTRTTHAIEVSVTKAR